MTERPKPASVLIYRPAAELLLAAAGGSRFEATYTRMYLCTRASFARFHRVPRTIEIRAQPISHESRVFKSLSAEGISVRRVITRLNFFSIDLICCSQIFAVFFGKFAANFFRVLTVLCVNWGKIHHFRDVQRYAHIFSAKARPKETGRVIV